MPKNLLAKGKEQPRKAMLEKKLKLLRIMQDKQWKTPRNGLDKELKMLKTMQDKKLKILRGLGNMRKEKLNKVWRPLVRH